jgi:hypothetical protein
MLKLIGGLHAGDVHPTHRFIDPIINDVGANNQTHYNPAVIIESSVVRLTARVTKQIVHFGLDPPRLSTWQAKHELKSPALQKKLVGPT